MLCDNNFTIMSMIKVLITTDDDNTHCRWCCKRRQMKWRN